MLHVTAEPETLDPTLAPRRRPPDPVGDDVSGQLFWSLVQRVPSDLSDVLSPGRLLGLLREAADLAVQDLAALVARDPAAVDAAYVLDSYLCFRAVAVHRLAHALHEESLTAAGPAARLRTAARALAEQAKAETGVEIHPAARIGPRFVVDHGVGTVIGETVTMGSDCYLLQGVVLGSLGIADNPAGPRHPTLGDGVEVGSFVRVLGAVRVGDGCVLDPHTVVITDVSAGCRVRLVTQCQVTSRAESTWIAGVRLCRGRVTVWGDGLADVVPALIDATGETVELRVERRSLDWLTAALPAGGWRDRPDLLLVDSGTSSRRALVRLVHQWRGTEHVRCATCPEEELP